MSASGIFLIVLCLVPLWGVWTYNRFIRRRNMVDEAWSGIDVQLKRRHNLIPNLIETVKGYSRHEADVLTEVTSVRAGSDVHSRSEQEQKISAALSNLLAVAEQYPELKASANFLDLQNSLQEIEDAIQNSRRYYNASARDMNILVDSFPSNLIARWFRFIKAEFFELDDRQTQSRVPEVKF